MWGTIIGFSLWGLASRVGQLGIQKRPLMSNPKMHVLAMGIFGYLGYWAHIWDERAQVLIAEKQQEIKERQQRLEGRRQAAIAVAIQEMEGQQAEVGGS